METITMWLFGLPYALWETQRRKVAVDRLLAELGNGDFGQLSGVEGLSCGADIHWPTDIERIDTLEQYWMVRDSYIRLYNAYNPSDWN